MDFAPFTRTRCSCEQDVANCKKQPGYLIPQDIVRIVDLLHMTTLEEFRERFRASAGALVGNAQTGETWRIPTITPRMRDGRCVFLNDKDRCEIHAVAPFGCSYFDVHMTYREWQERSIWGHQQIDDPELSKSYRALRDLLSEEK